jgi:hypothetical protein
MSSVPGGIRWQDNYDYWTARNAEGEDNGIEIGREGSVGTSSGYEPDH